MKDHDCISAFWKCGQTERWHTYSWEKFSRYSWTCSMHLGWKKAKSEEIRKCYPAASHTIFLFLHGYVHVILYWQGTWTFSVTIFSDENKRHIKYLANGNCKFCIEGNILQRDDWQSVSKGWPTLNHSVSLSCFLSARKKYYSAYLIIICNLSISNCFYKE